MKTPDLDQVKQNDPAYKKDTIMDSVKKGNLGDAKDKVKKQSYLDFINQNG